LRPLARAAAVGVLLAAAATAVATPLRHDLSGDTVVVFLVAVIAATWLAGLPGGLAATTLSALSLDYFVLSPIHHLEPGDEGHLLRLGSFIVVSALVGSLYDATRTARRRAEEGLVRERAKADELARTAAELRVANGAKDEFISLVSHELKTPLTTIVMEASLLERHATRAGAADDASALREITEEAQRLARIIDNLLSLARLDRGQRVATEPVLGARAVKLAVARHLARHGSREIRLDIDPHVIVAADPLHVDQILQNLLSNAEKYSPPGAPIDISVSQAGPDVMFSVADRGDGIAPEDVARVFEPFYRASSTAQRAPGIGVGLAVCRRLVEAQGGRIAAEPRRRGGTRVSFTLPIAEEEDGRSVALEAGSERRKAGPLRVS
jgi:K+-sensing histidine kinase KdpD